MCRKAHSRPFKTEKKGGGSVNRLRFLILILFLCALGNGGCARMNAEAVQADSMMIPQEARRTTDGYVYTVLREGSGEAIPKGAAVKVHLRVRGLDGRLIDEGEGTISPVHSAPFVAAILPEMALGEIVRIWGESEGRVWEVEALSIDEAYAPPPDVAQVPEYAQLLEEFDDVFWAEIVEGQGEKIHDGQAFRVHVSRWNARGEILESSLGGAGVIVVYDDAFATRDPIHYALMGQLRMGGKGRVWVPSYVYGGTEAVVEDIQVVEAIPILERPTALQLSERTEGMTEVSSGVWVQFESRGGGETLERGDTVWVDMSCWDAETGKLIEATRLRGGAERMTISESLGIYETIMMSAAPGDQMTVWIPAQALPESVSMSLTCRIAVGERSLES